MEKTVEDIATVIEQKLATLYGGKVTGGNKFAIPDLSLPAETADRIAAALGIDVEDARELEVKSKQKTLKPSKKNNVKNLVNIHLLRQVPHIRKA